MIKETKDVVILLIKNININIDWTFEDLKNKFSQDYTFHELNDMFEKYDRDGDKKLLFIDFLNILF